MAAGSPSHRFAWRSPFYSSSPAHARDRLKGSPRDAPERHLLRLLLAFRRFLLLFLLLLAFTFLCLLGRVLLLRLLLFFGSLAPKFQRPSTLWPRLAPSTFFCTTGQRKLQTFEWQQTCSLCKSVGVENTSYGLTMYNTGVGIARTDACDGSTRMRLLSIHLRDACAHCFHMNLRKLMPEPSKISGSPRQFLRPEAHQTPGP